MRTHYEVMIFPGEGINGAFAFNVRVSRGKSYWTSDMVRTGFTDEADLERYIREQIRLLRKIDEE